MQPSSKIITKKCIHLLGWFRQHLYVSFEAKLSWIRTGSRWIRTQYRSVISRPWHPADHQNPPLLVLLFFWTQDYICPITAFKLRWPVEYIKHFLNPFIRNGTFYATRQCLISGWSLELKMNTLVGWEFMLSHHQRWLWGQLIIVLYGDLGSMLLPIYVS